MSAIYNYIPSDKVLNVHNYNQPNILHTYVNIKFRTQLSELYGFQTPIACLEDKVVSISNKQLSFLVDVLHHFIGDIYGKCMQSTYTTIINSLENTLYIDDHVFQFFDYESVSGTGHSYDYMFYSLYIYRLHNMKCKFLVVESDNVYYNTILSLIKKHYNIEYIYIKPSVTYCFKSFSCVQSYQNILFHEVKEFINDTFIKPIINKYELINSDYSTIVHKIKFSNQHNINRLNSAYIKTNEFDEVCRLYAIKDLNEVDEEYKIYLLNKASTIYITWGSSYYININYYLLNTFNKTISVVFHSSIMAERTFLEETNAMIHQTMPLWATGSFRNQVYTSWKFNGEIICTDCLTTLCKTTRLLCV
jgi:hypothetical protein